MADTPKPYGNVAYADEEQGKYPIDTAEHVRAAWDYINVAKNAAKYSPGKLATVKAKIKAAAARFGIEIGEDSKSSSQEDLRILSSVITLPPEQFQPKITSPAPTGTHFYTAGRMLSYNVPNRNGLVFFREDCQSVIPTLKNSLANLAHIKPGNDAVDSYKINNGVIGSIQDVVEDDEGIDILCKNDKALVKAMGFQMEDVSPEGQFASFSQESDFSPQTSPFITVPVNKVDFMTPSDIVDEIPYTEGITKGLKTSYYNPITGRWNYAYDDKGNAVFIRMRPLSFAGVGHVIRPADNSAQIYSYAAALEGEKAISDLYPRADDPDMGPEPPYDFF